MMKGGRCANGNRFGLGGLVPERILGFGGRVRGEKPSTNEKPRVNEWTMCKWEWFRQAQPNGFGVGGLVHFDRLSTTPAADCGFRGACPWGWSTDSVTDSRT